jgi:hypothetical protein
VDIIALLAIVGAIVLSVIIVLMVTGAAHSRISPVGAPAANSVRCSVVRPTLPIERSTPGFRMCPST